METKEWLKKFKKPKEKNLQKEAMDYLNGLGKQIWFKHVRDDQQRGIPDIIGWVLGQPFMIELKIGSNKPTGIQCHELEQGAIAGALTTAAWSIEEVETFMDKVIEEALKRNSRLK